MAVPLKDDTKEENSKDTDDRADSKIIYRHTHTYRYMALLNRIIIFVMLLHVRCWYANTVIRMLNN